MKYFFLLFLLLFFSCNRIKDSQAKPKIDEIEYIVPKQFIGNVLIVYDDSGNNFVDNSKKIVIRVPETGRLHTHHKAVYDNTLMKFFIINEKSGVDEVANYREDLSNDNSKLYIRSPRIGKLKHNKKEIHFLEFTVGYPSQLDSLTKVRFSQNNRGRVRSFATKLEKDTKD